MSSLSMSNAFVRRGLSLGDVLVTVAIGGVALCALIPTLGAVRRGDGIAQSMNNLNVIFQAHMTYAGDFNGRQLTTMPDNLSDLLSLGYPATYSTGGSQGQVPSVPLGFDCKGELFQTRSSWAIQPLYFPANCGLGNWRAWNTQPFHQYVNGKVYDPTFWAPNDLVLELIPQIEEFFKLDCPWPGSGTPFYFPTYARAASAQFDPLVHANDDIGQTHPLDLPFGHRTPSFSQARYPDLKTFMLEHWWIQNAPKDPINPDTGLPYYFNGSPDSKPVTLFFDGQVRLMAVQEAMTSDQFVQMGGRPSLVASFDPGCFEDQGYFEQYSYMGEDVSSYHIFTADGILGRDTIFAINDGPPIRRDPE